MAAGVEREPGVVAGAVAGVCDVDEVVVDGDADGLVAARPDRTPLRLGQPSVRLDAQDGDLVAACVSGKQVAAVGAQLQARPESRFRCPVPAPPTEKGDPGNGVKRAVRVPIEPRDGVRAGGVVVDVEMSDHVGLRARRRRARL